MSRIKREKRTPKPIWNAIRQVNKGFFKYNVKLNLDKLRNTLRTTLIDIWEYVIPIWKISGLFKSIKSKKDLENFIQERSAHVSQTTLYGYLKTRIGVKYIAMMEDEVFLKSINIAKWNIYVVALADCAFYVFSYLISEKNLKKNDCKEIFLNILENEKKEITVINSFLPKQLSDEETKKICEETIKSVGASSMKDMGKIMGTLKSKHSDSLDFSKVSVILKGLLS